MGRLWLVVLTNAVDGREDEFNDWYTGTHLGDVLATEGFRAAQRFRWVPSKLSRDSAFNYLAIYEVDEDSRERAEQALLKAANTEAMPISDTMEKRTATWWFQSITDRVEALGEAVR